MSYHPSVDERARVCGMIEELLQAAFDDWSMMVGVEAKVARSLAVSLPYEVETIKRVVKTGLLMETKIDAEISSSIYFTFPLGFFGPAVYEAMMSPINDDLEFSEANEGHIGALKELMNLFCGSATRAVQASHGETYRVSQSVDDICLYLDADEIKRSETSDQAILCVQTQVEYRGTKHQICALLPRTLSECFAVKQVAK